MPEPWLIIDGNRIAVYERLKQLCEYAGKPSDWCDRLWAAALEDPELFEELAYYMNRHSFLDRAKAGGYSVTDLYVQQLDLYNLRQDTGKHTAACNKEEMVLNAFEAMARMRNDPDRQQPGKWQEGFGMDQMP